MLEKVSFLPANDDAPEALHEKPARSLHELFAHGLLKDISFEMKEAEARHPVLLSPALLNILAQNPKAEALARQFVPDAREVIEDESALLDPIGDEIHRMMPGLIHRYPDRVLLNPVRACPATCRFCFRRGRINKKEGRLTEEELHQALAYIAANKNIWEVILSGGEPLMLSPRRLRDLLVALDNIPHVKTLRIHTRAPVTMPEKFTPDFIEALTAPEKPVHIFLHCNHPCELAKPTRKALRALTEAGIPLYSQSVLLKGVNADIETLTNLMRAFVENKVKPHYIHHPDKARGTRHFSLPLEEGRALIQKLQGRLSGLCQPLYMLEIPGGYGKVNVLSSQVQKTDKGWRLENYKGEVFSYED